MALAIDCGAAPVVNELRKRLDTVMQEAALTVADKIKGILLDAGMPLLVGEKLIFCAHNPYGIFQHLTLPAVVIYRAFDHSLLPRDILTMEGVFSCEYCIFCTAKVLAFNTMKEYSSEEYMGCGAGLLTSIEMLILKKNKETEKAISDSLR